MEPEPRDRSRGEDEEEVEENIEDAGEHIQNTGCTRVTACLEHAPGKNEQLRDGHREHEDEEVSRGVGADGRCAAEPARERSGDGHPDARERDGPRQRAHEALPQDRPRPCGLVCADRLRDLDGEARRGRAHAAPEEPGRRGDEPDGGGAVGADAPDHRRVDVLHEDERELGEDGREAQPPDERRAVSGPHGVPRAELRQELVGRARAAPPARSCRFGRGCVGAGRGRGHGVASRRPDSGKAPAQKQLR